MRGMVGSIEQVFGMPVRIVSNSGVSLASSSREAPLCAMINEEPAGRRACGAIVSEVKRLRVTSSEGATHGCFTGARYRVVPIEYEGGTIGRAILGPYLPPSVESVPDTLLAIEGIDPARAAELLPHMARATEATAEIVSKHLVAVLDVILWSGHKALLTSKMHIASIRESYRELSEKNAALEQAYERQQELDKLKSNFLATISHELRTPLTSILGYSEMLVGGIAGELTGPQLDFVQIIQAKSDQLLKLIMSLLDLSKLESGTVMMRRSDVAIGVVLAEAASTVAPVATKKGVTLTVDAPGDLPLVLGDPERLRQVFVNLGENAIKFTPPGGTVQMVARQMATEADVSDEPGMVLLAPLRQMVEVRVADTGIGIPEAERDKVFDPFYQVDQSSTREHGGTGLGLSIVKRLVEAHHGTVHIEGHEPTGAVFVVRLPASRPSAPPSKAAISVRFA
ncbi:PocR ligand-binding domain-containing protein [Polyangium jinanense]|uniref:histidine kinase n=2 Tax=Polyangium jinanense TaxID=2829994 RepID=A0A9X3XAA7_9BACT|nr:PocR ligand-binding domain-containing protein [Polyangium jinanense]MDC3986624.1 PocR ligand-binding domain-containing protein [Polyangium jinanense]